MDTYYDAIAQGYDRLHEEEQLKKLEFIKTKIYEYPELRNFLNSEYKLLDVGCGTGISTRFFNVKERHGIDPGRELLKIAIQKDPKGKYLRFRAEDMKFSHNEFDLIISLTAIQNFHDIGTGLKRIHNSGKKFILTFLKKSDQKLVIEKLITEIFKVIRIFEQEKDIIYFCEQFNKSSSI